VASLRSPKTKATTCRVRRHRATQSQRTNALLRTKLHSSSSSRTSSHSASGSVCSRGGKRLRLLFQPAGDGIARDAEDAAQPSQAGPLVVRREDRFLLLFGVAVGLRIGSEGVGASAAAIALHAIAILPVPDHVGADAMGAGKCMCNHPLNLQQQPRSSHYPAREPVGQPGQRSYTRCKEQPRGCWETLDREFKRLFRTTPRADGYRFNRASSGVALDATWDRTPCKIP
jgi:hypothetical protein